MVRAFRSLSCSVFAVVLAPVALSAQMLLITAPVAEREASTGETYTGRIVVANPTGVAQTVRITQADSGAMARSNAKWVLPQMQEIVIPARSERAVSFVVRVPPDDSLRGTYWSRIVLEGARTATSVEVATHVGTAATRTVTFGNPAAGHDSTGSATLDIDLTAAGERGVRPRVTAEVYDSTGSLRARVAQTGDLLYPGSTARQRFDFPRLSSGTYKVMLFADIGGERVFATQLTVVF